MVGCGFFVVGALSSLGLGDWSREYPPRRLVLERVRHLFAATSAGVGGMLR